MQLFAASLSLAPLIAFIILIIDIRVDAKRLLWLYRRPVAFIAQDIGKHSFTSRSTVPLVLVVVVVVVDDMMT